MDKYAPITEIAKEVRRELKNKFPKCKFSVLAKSASMCDALIVRVMSAPEPVTVGNVSHTGLNEYTLKNDYDEENPICNGVELTKYGWELLKQVCEISNKRNWDNSDSQIDYFDVNYYFSLYIGKWDKAFKVK